MRQNHFERRTLGHIEMMAPRKQYEGRDGPCSEAADASYSHPLWRVRRHGHSAKASCLRGMNGSANRGPELASAMDKSICAFLPKPFDIAVLSSLVKSCILPEPPGQDIAC